MTLKEHFTAAQEWIQFVHEYVALLDAQLRGIKDSMAETVTECMTVISNMSRSVTDQAAKADEALLESGMSTLSHLESKEGRETATSEDKLRRLGGKFAKSVETLSLLDDKVGDYLLTLMGSLSNEDVIIQRLEHVIKGVAILQSNLIEIVPISERGLSHVDVQEFRAQVLVKLFATYTMEEEKKTYRRYFEEIRPEARVA